MNTVSGSARLRILFTDSTLEYTVPLETNLYEALSACNKLVLGAPCNIEKVCGKCKVIIRSGNISPPSESELKCLKDRELKNGFRLACMTRILGDLDVLLPADRGTTEILTGQKGVPEDIDPPVKKKSCDLPPVTGEDLRSELTRLSGCLGIDRPEAGPDTMKTLCNLREKSDGTVTALYTGNKIFKTVGGKSDGTHFGAAVDIGTVTVAVYLLDLVRGKVIDAVSELNLQSSGGPDIISRISYAFSNADGLNELQTKTVNQLEDIIDRLILRNNISKDSLGLISITGNTAMVHLLMGVNPKNIALSPFVPVFTSSQILNPDEIGLGSFNNSRILVFPGITGFVGPDITAGILATGMFREKKASFLIDLGVNCEIVLGNMDGIICCSSAAGPALEGVEISCGIGGIEGAINNVSVIDETLNFTTIGGRLPAGICGSGILDMAAILITCGVINKKGKFRDIGSINHPAIKDIISEGSAGSGGAAIELTGPEIYADNRQIIFTQKDLREFQGAKAAVAGGINTLLSEGGLDFDDISNVYITGGFGCSISEKSAEITGLIPKGLEGKTVSVGNTAGIGAILAAFSEKEWNNCITIAEKSRYFELSTCDAFLGEFGKQMYFDIPEECKT